MVMEEKYLLSSSLLGLEVVLLHRQQISSTFCIVNAKSVSDSRRKKLRRDSRFKCLYISINFSLQTRHHEEFPLLTRCLFFFLPPAQICFQCFSHSCIFKCLQLYGSPALLQQSQHVKNLSSRLIYSLYMSFTPEIFSLIKAECSLIVTSETKSLFNCTSGLDENRWHPQSRLSFSFRHS